MALAFKSWEEAVRWLMASPEQQELVKSCYYDSPLQAAAERYWKSSEWLALRAYLPQKTGKVLDLGAGHGISSYALAKDGWKVTALEPDPSDLVGGGAIRRLAKENQLPITVIQESGEAIPCAADTYDLIFARQVLHHAHDLNKLCKEGFRVLKPGGLMIAIRDHVISANRDLPKFLAAHPLHHLYGGEHAYRLNEYLVAMKNSGFLVKNVLRPFDSVINYAPYTEETLCQELCRRLGKYPGGNFFVKIFTIKQLFHTFLRVLSLVDRRPGRVFSFVLQKPSS